MTKVSLSMLSAYVTEVQHALGLDHWMIVVSPEPAAQDNAEETVQAETMVEHYGYRATMKFKPEMLDGDEAELRHNVVHEMVHLFLEHWALDVREVMTSTASHDTTLERAYERSVDAIARSIEQWLPMPDFSS